MYIFGDGLGVGTNNSNVELDPNDPFTSLIEEIEAAHRAECDKDNTTETAAETHKSEAWMIVGYAVAGGRKVWAGISESTKYKGEGITFDSGNQARRYRDQLTAGEKKKPLNNQISWLTCYTYTKFL